MKPTSNNSLADIGVESSSLLQGDLTAGMISADQNDRLSCSHPITPQPVLSPKRTSPTHDQGHLAELLVMTDLLSQGYQVTLTPSTWSYDLLVDLGGRFIRIQVKSTKSPLKKDLKHSEAYIFEMRRFGNRGSSQARNYESDEFDIAACVALDIKTIAYIPKPKSTQVKFKPIGEERRYRESKPYINECPFSKALNQIGVK